MGIKRLVHTPTRFRQNFDELFHLPFNFAAVPDVYGPGDARGFSLTFNAGVLAIQSSSCILKNMKKSETARCPVQQAEQAFLNLYFGAKAARLRYIQRSLSDEEAQSGRLGGDKVLTPDERKVPPPQSVVHLFRQ
ncbi:hypothetical protein PC9H_001600 [Pleurotus ostreatus]|uniref:Uncharacterized protein n=1 Tax=Pleurotus ostreatus TaxID=5322 RepID=A0A8H7A778_PLEOS|nr:uncharacterized protein PC9H_001600 [Pleurotus ostreatus]KAF7441251.1 hypothetical protein PC9H_001600 [Pleurotus ostreatus]